MRWLKKTALILASFLLAALALLIVAASVAWFKPELFFTEKRLRWARGYAPADLKIEWRKFEPRFEALGWKGKKISLAIEGLRAEYAGLFTLDLNRADIAFSMRWKTFRPKITQIDRVVLDVNEFRLVAGETAAEEENSPLPDLRPAAFAEIYPEEIRLDLVQDISLDVKKFVAESREGPPLLASAAIKKISASGRSARLDLKARVSQGAELRASLRADLTLDPAVPSLDVEARADGNFGGWRGEFPFTAAWADSIRLRGKPDLRSHPHRLDTNISLDWRKNGLLFRLGSFTSETIWKQGRLSTHECVLNSTFDEADGLPRSADLSCGLTARPKNRLIPTLEAKIRAHAEAIPVSAREFRMKFTIDENSADSFLLSRLAAKGELSVRGGKIREPMLDLDFTARVPKFQAWKEAWEGTPLAIPAPLHIMDGPLELSVKSRIDDEKLLTAEAKVSADLRSASQSFVIIADGQLKIEDPLAEKRRVSVEALAKLSDIRLEAPPLRIEEPPQLLPDKRFVTTAQYEKEKKQESLKARMAIPGVDWKVKIESLQPVRIKTNLFPADVPIAVNLNLSSAREMAGYIELQPMPVNVFRKKTMLDKLRITFTPESKYAALDGRLDYRTPEVLIKILLLGNTEEPRVEFQSDPPLSRQQIVAVLLFNKSLNELSEEEVSSTQNTSQALSDGAFGLFSLLFLSSTPIQSIGYDPVTQSYSARVSLGGKTTLSVGSDFVESREVGLRRRLGGPWAIRTELRQELDRPDVVVTLLEWFKRF